MSEDFDRVNELVKEASGVIAATNGKVQIRAAMALVGFSTPERLNMKLYQQVRRLAAKTLVVVAGKGGRKPPPVAGDASTVMAVSESQGSGISSLTYSNFLESDEVSETSTAMSSTARRLLLEVANDSDDGGGKPKATKVRRQTSKQVQRANAAKLHNKKRETQAMKQATVLINRSNALPPNHPEKKTIVEIVDLTNSRLNSSLSVVSASRYVRNGLIGVSPLKKGPIGNFEPRIYDALK
jgi:hypothetical protein